MAKVVLHIGTGKSGTSTIQQKLEELAPQLAASQVIVPDFGSRRHHGVAVAMRRIDGTFQIPTEPAMRSRQARDELLTRIESRFATGVRLGDVWVLSSEYFSTSYMSTDAISELKEYLGRWFDEVHAIGYFRRQDSLVPSLFTERAKTFSPNRPLSKFDETFLDGDAAALADVRGMISRWQAGFGSDFFPRPYLRKWQSDPTALLADFSATTGIDITAAGVGQGAPRVVNPAISARGVAFLLWIFPELNARILTQPNQDQPRESDAVGRLLSAYSHRDASGAVVFRNAKFTKAVSDATAGPTLRLTEQLKVDIDRRFAEPNRAILDLTSDPAIWQEWLAEPSVPTASPDQLELSDTAALKLADELAPHTTIDVARKSPLARLRRQLFS